MTGIPTEALDKHVALLGMTGAGKTSVIKAAIVEPDLNAGRRVIIITPKDDWWGLRLSKSGKGAGYDIPIFGGRHGDYPLTVRDAALLAEAYGTMKGSAIFCTSLLSVQDRARWFAAFAEALLSKNRGWIRVVIDEAHVFMPKQGGKGGGAIPAALHAGNELVSQGRSGGLRIVLASQRSAKLHNDALTQCSCLVAMLLMAPHDRDAVKDWIEDQADPVKGKEIIASLANLRAGQAWVWAPRAGMLEKIQFPLPATFDSSAAPDDDSADAVTLKPVNLDALKGKLSRIEEEKKAADPTALRKQLEEARAKIRQLEDTAVDPEALKNAEQRGFEQCERKTKAATERALAKVLKGSLIEIRALLNGFADKVDDELRAASEKALQPEAVQFEPSVRPQPPTPITVKVPSRPLLTRRGQASSPAAPTANGEFTRPQHRVLRSLAMWAALGHPEPSREMVAAGAGYAPGSGGFNNLIGGLNGVGAISIPKQGHLSLCIGMVSPPTQEEGCRTLLSILSNPQKKLVAALHGVASLSRDELAEASGYAAGSGGFNNLIGKLNTLKITYVPAQGRVTLSDWAEQLLQGFDLATAA